MSRSALSSIALTMVLSAVACAPAPTGTRVEITPSEATTLEDLTVGVTMPSVIGRANGELTYL